MNVDMDGVPCFFSKINTVLDEKGKPVPGKIQEGVKWHIDYSYKEYVGFINYFHEIVKEMPDITLEQEKFKMKATL